MRILHATAILCGGGADELPLVERIRYLADVDQTFKLYLHNRYEHFTPSDETLLHEGRPLRVFVWSTRTYVAE